MSDIEEFDMYRQKILDNKEWEKYGDLFNKVVAILTQYDPILLTNGDETDTEYMPEAKTIVSQLEKCESEEDACNLVKEEFEFWFGVEIMKSNYYELIEKAGKEIWKVWKEYNK